MRQSFRSLLCVLTLSAGRVLAQSDPGAMPSPPPPKGPPTKVLPQTNPNKAPAGGEIRKAVRVPSGPAAPTGPIPPGKAGGEMLLQMAFASYESGNSALALEQLDQAEKLKPNVADAWNLRGAILLRQNDYNRAEAAFKRAVNLDPDLWAAKFNVAEIPFRRKEYAKALKNFEDLSIQTDRYKLAIEWELLQYKLVVCSLLLNDEPGAQKRFGRLRPGGASPAYFYCQAAFAFAKKDKEGANKFLSYADASSRPGMRSIFSDTLVRVGWVAGGSVTYDPTQGQSSGPRSRGLPVPVLPPPIDLDLPSGAGGIASPDVPGGPKSEPPLAGPGEVAAPKEKPAEDAKPEGKPESKSEAKPEAKPALTPPPLKEPKPNASLRSLPGWIAVRSFSPRAQDGASSDYRRIANQPDAYAAKLREAQQKLRAKEFDTASRLLQEAISLTDNPAEVHNLRGAIEFYRGDFPKAEALFRQALAADPASWPARFNLAEIAFAKKEYAAARELYEAMLPETDTLKQPVEREMLQFKVVLSLLQEGKVELAQRIAERLPLAGQTPARYYCQVALEAHAKRYDKAAEVLNSAEQFYATSLNFLFSQSLEKLGILPLPNTAAASPPAATQAPTAAATPPPVAAATPAPAASPLPKKTEPPRSPESQMLDEIVSGRAMSPATPAAVPTTAAGAAPAAVAAPARVVQVRSADAPQGWLADVVRSLFPGSEPTRLEVLLFALGVLNLLGMLWLMGNEVFTRWIRPRSLSLHTAGSVGVAVNKVRNIERLRIRFSIANMTTRSQTVGQLDAVMSGQGDWKRTFHWRKLCLNPSGNSAAFEEMDVYPLVLLPGEVASLYVDFVADGSDAPAQWAKGSYRIEVLGWTEAHAGRSRPDFKAAFPLEVPSIPWRNQELLVDLAIDRSKDGKPRQPQFLDTEEIEARNAAAAAAEDHAKYSGAAPASAAPAAGSPSATTKTTTPPRQTRKPVETGPELPLFQQTAVATASAAETIVPTAEAPVAIPPPEPAPLVGVQPEPTRNARSEAPAASQNVAPPARPLPPIATHPAARPSNRPPGTTLVPLPPRASESVAAPAPPPPAKDLARANLGPRHRR